MKKVNPCSAQFKIIQPVQNHPNTVKLASYTASLASHEMENNKNIKPNDFEKKLSKQTKNS